MAGDAVVAGEQQRRRAIVERAGVAGGDRPVGGEHRLELRQPLETGVSTRPFVRGHLGVADLDRDQLGIEPAGSLGGDRLAMALQGERVLGLATDLVLGGQHLGGHAEADRVLGGHGRVHQSPAEGGVDELLGARQPISGAGQDERSPAHRLDSAGDRDVTVTEGEVGGDPVDGVESGAAQPVDGRAGNRHR